MNKKDLIQKKIYMQIEFELQSSLTIGSGDNSYTDNDIIRDSLGRPYIPASSLAGVYESLLEDSDFKKYFGNTGKQGDYENSKIVIYDATLMPESDVFTTRRDMVALDEFKTAKDGAKFDMETVEPGARFVTYVEQNLFDGDCDITDDIVKLWCNGRVFLGAKTTRGYGAVKPVRIGVKSFDLTLPEQAKDWLKFNMYGNDYDYSDVKGLGKRKNSLVLSLKQVGGISIRRYTTEVADSTEGTAPDYKQLTVKMRSDNDNTVEEVPVIPGTSWAGAFRSRMELLAPELKNKDYFGAVMPVAKRSKIRFSESIIRNAKPKEMTRNAIDRFTGGTVDGALYTERTYYDGKTELIISFTEPPDDLLKRALAAAVADLHYGFLSVGGLASIGRGLFEITDVNGEPLPNSNPVTGGESAVYSFILDQLNKMAAEPDKER